MGVFGRFAPAGATSFMPPLADPNAVSAGPAFITPKAADKFAAPPNRFGIFGRLLRNAMMPQGLQTLGAGLRQVGGVDGALDAVSQRLAAAQQAQQQQVRQASEDAYQEQQRRGAEETRLRLADWAKQQGGDAMVDPAGAFQANRIANAPLTPSQRADDERQTLSLAETMRHNRATERQSSSNGGAGGGGASGLTPADIQDMGSIVALSGMPVGDLTGSRDRRVNTPVMAAAMETRRRMRLSPGEFAAVRLAYRGDQASYATLQRTRDQVAANEGAARSALQNIASLQQAVPRDQMSRVPAANSALQALNAQLRGEGPLGAYVGGVVTARMEIARVLSGNNSPPVEAMHEAERLLPTNITPQALAAVSANLEREMEFRTSAFDTVLGDIRQRVGFDPAAGGSPPPPPPTPPPTVRTYNARTGRIE